MTAHKQKRNRATDKTAYQILGAVKLFIEASGVEDVRRITQSDLARFCEVMGELPPSYRKSKAEQAMSLDQIIASAKRSGKPRGLSAATINRNLTMLGQIIKHARAQGIPVNDHLDLSALRENDARDDRDKVLPFSQEDLHKIFQHPIWQGCAGEARRHVPGEMILRDGLYWLPLLAAYTGARRAELAGLLRGDVRQEDGVWVITVRENKDRRLKNAASRRMIPLHPHLIDLGFIEHAAGNPDARLFPDLTKKASIGSLGDSIQYAWDKILERQLEKDRAKKRFHSFRHSMVDALRSDPLVPDHVRRDILGHVAGDVEDRTYGSRATPDVMLEAISRLPEVW